MFLRAAPLPPFRARLLYWFLPFMAYPTSASASNSSSGRPIRPALAFQSRLRNPSSSSSSSSAKKKYKIIALCVFTIFYTAFLYRSGVYNSCYRTETIVAAASIEMLSVLGLYLSFFLILTRRLRFSHLILLYSFYSHIQAEPVVSYPKAAA